MIIGLWWIVGGGEEEEGRGGGGIWMRCILWHKLHDPQIITDRLARQLLHKKEILASIDDIYVWVLRKFILYVFRKLNLCACSENILCVRGQTINSSVCFQQIYFVCIFKKKIFCACSDNTFCVHNQKINFVCVFSKFILCVFWGS